MSEQNGRGWVVMKFGGTSVSSVDCWSTICAQTRHELANGKRVMLLVSALSGVTNLLTRLADGVDTQKHDEILAQLRVKHQGLIDSLGLAPSPAFSEHWNSLLQLLALAGRALKPADRTALLAHGELLSSSLGFEVLVAAELAPIWQDARSLLKISDESGSDLLTARCDDDVDPILEQRLAGEGALHITQGFIASGPPGGNLPARPGRFRHISSLSGGPPGRGIVANLD